MSFVIIRSGYVNRLVNRRPGEIKLGEKVWTVQGDDWVEELKASPARFVLIGIPEDIGVRANYGTGGTETTWLPALEAILNVQHTSVLDGRRLLALGVFDFSALMQQAHDLGIDEMRQIVSQIDDEVSPVIQSIITANKVPIIIGGGHNNAYPILKGASLAKKQKVNCINLDAHSDYRHMEGRHSGNGFRYAWHDGYLDKYAIVGLHENYNAQNIVDDLQHNTAILPLFFEDIFLKEKLSYRDAILQAIHHTTGMVGLELDLDCITHTLSSAATPVGITPLQARQYVTICGQNAAPLYLHLPEAAVRLQNGRDDAYVPKMITYLVTDFIKAYSQ